MKWQEFWDLVDLAIHSHPSLNPEEKVNYLRAKLEGEAADVISGLTLTHAYYVRLMKERFSHYTSLIDLPTSSGHTSGLRSCYDVVVKHLRSLQTVGEDVNTKMLVSLIMTKLPKDVITHLTDQKEDEQEWILKLLRDKLHR